MVVSERSGGRSAGDVERGRAEREGGAGASDGEGLQDSFRSGPLFLYDPSPYVCSRCGSPLPRTLAVVLVYGGRTVGNRVPESLVFDSTSADPSL